jgi:hypothetical protein
MSRYYLTEAYGELYNPRKTDETFYENLKFVDYLMNEQIEEVMESLLWEFMDYGNTLDESYNLIQNTFSDVILEEVLAEAMNPRQKAERAARVGAERAATLKTARRQERVAKVTGAVKKAGESVKSAAAGVGSAVSKAATGTYNRAAGLAGKAKAALTKVVRTGAAAALKAGRSAERMGSGVEKAGEKAQVTTRTKTITSGGGRPAPVETETETKSGGSKRRAIGGLLKRAGKAVVGAIRSEKNKAAVASAKRTGAMQGPSPAPKSASSPKVELGLKTLGKGGPSTAHTFSRHAQRRIVPIGANKKELTGAARDTAIRAARKAAIAESNYELLAQCILEDLINEGYADNLENALVILENLSEDVIENIASQYLED